MNDLPANIRKKIRDMNIGYKIKIKLRLNKDKTYTLRLDYFNNGERQRPSLGMQIFGDPKHKSQDEEKLKIAQIVRDKKEVGLFEKGNDIVIASRRKKMDFLKYYEKIQKLWYLIDKGSAKTGHLK